MKIGVIAEGDTLDSYVAEDFGHAPFFLIVDSDTLDYQVVKNEHADSLGAGMKVANAIAGLGVDAVITGGIGSHGLDILRKAGIHVAYDEDGTVEECIMDLKRRTELRKRAGSD
ncbi:MAG: NifB/NifX family molybdenum-iron cluster-binding protein [Candidatus Methanoplasma sp.]|jgi:predicted Fe-Mo cluster-binding NifX family protein|nr:NifB/NifX family molybdenum-iron cluster-binding protein [Candidatus Methanoplasma sp.]